jgi:hypothetical protein
MHSIVREHIAPTTTMGAHSDEFAMNFVPFGALFLVHFLERRKAEVRTGSKVRVEPAHDDEDRKE